MFSAGKRNPKKAAASAFFFANLLVFGWAAFAPADGDHDKLSVALEKVLRSHGFTGRMQSQVEKRLNHRVDPKLADLGRLLWFDTIGGLNDDNTCAGCHSPTAGFGDTQSIAIGVDNNGMVGPHREGPRNQRRTPMVLNTVFFPTLMWNGRFSANSNDPFDNRQGFTFPLPEGTTLSNQPHLLNAQAFIPPTERVEAAGFVFPGGNQEIRDEVIRRLNATPNYRKLFGQSFRSVKNGGPITYDMFAAAITEFECTLVFANAPIDKFARGNRSAMSEPMKRGALLFFGKANCVTCHAVSGKSNEMFSDFQNRVAGTPQIMPSTSNMVFDGPGANEDFGLEQVTGNPADRYKFRSSPLRNTELQPSFMHNGAFTTLESAIRYHMNPRKHGPLYQPAHLAPDLRGPLGPIQTVLARLDPAFDKMPKLSDRELYDLVSFVRYGLLDEKANTKEFAKLIPGKVPSGRPTLTFERSDGGP